MLGSVRSAVLAATSCCPSVELAASSNGASVPGAAAVSTFSEAFPCGASCCWLALVSTCCAVAFWPSWPEAPMAVTIASLCFASLAGFSCCSAANALAGAMQSSAAAVRTAANAALVLRIMASSVTLDCLRLESGARPNYTVRREPPFFGWFVASRCGTISFAKNIAERGLFWLYLK